MGLEKKGGEGGGEGGEGEERETSGSGQMSVAEESWLNKDGKGRRRSEVCGGEKGGGVRGFKCDIAEGIIPPPADRYTHTQLAGLP